MRHVAQNISLPLLFGGTIMFFIWVALPMALPRHYVDLLVFTAIFTIGGLGVGLLLGQCGILNLAQSVFYAIGAYSSAYCTTQLGWPIPVGATVGVGLSAVVAVAIGWPVLRLTGFFLALATLAVANIATVLFLEWDWLTGGTLGIGGIPKINIFGFQLDTPQRFYYLVWPLTLVLLWLAHNLVSGRPGLAMRAMRDAPAAAEVLAIDLRQLKQSIFVLSAVFGAFAGSLFAHYVSFVSMQSFTVERSILFLLIPVIAGTRSVWGLIMGALFVTFVPELLSRFGDIHQMMFGLALVAIVMLMPDGFAGFLITRWKLRRNRRS